MSPKYLAIVAVALFVSAAIAGFYSWGLEGPSSSISSSSATSSSSTTSSSPTCDSAPPASGQKLTPDTFGGISDYSLAPNRTPAGFAVAPDGSVWFGEWGLPGLGHLTPDGTLTEYKWPYPTDSPLSICGQETQIWGVALWNGTVWAADNVYSRLVSTDPATGKTEMVSTNSTIYPYTLSVGAGDLWFTDDSSPGIIGRLMPNSTNPQYLSLPDNRGTSSEFILFQNGTRAYVLTADPVTFKAQLFAFDPSVANPTFISIGGNQTIYEPTSLALADGGIWATEHSASAMAFLNFTTDDWTVYPTSTVPYVPDVLTYFDGSNGTAVWFNEHYSNRMGVITNGGRSLTEYSITDPPLFNITTILENYNMVTMGLASNGAWFGAATAGIVGFANGSYVPPFAVSDNVTSLHLARGASAHVGLQVTGNLSGSGLSLQFEDNEFYNGSSSQLVFTRSPTETSNDGVSTTNVTVTAANSLRPGTYIAAFTVTNGSVYRTVYCTVDVT